MLLEVKAKEKTAFSKQENRKYKVYILHHIKPRRMQRTEG